MINRRQFMQYASAAGTAFAVYRNMIFDESTAMAQETAPPDGHFHPKGKPPSAHTIEVIRQAKTKLPFADKKDFEDADRGFIATLKDPVIKRADGQIAYDLSSYDFLKSSAPPTAIR